MFEEWLGEDPISNFGFRNSAPSRSMLRRPLPSAESESMLRSLTDRGVSGLSYLASAIDKPGRAVRGLLGGRPGEFLAAVPFSDTLGLTDPERAISGRQLTDRAGITSRSDKGWGAWGAGVGLEMLTDPLSFVTLGPRAAATATGRALSSAGQASKFSRRQLLQGFEDTAGAMRAAGETEPVIRHAVDSGRMVATDAMEQAAAKAGAPIRKGDPLGGLLGIGLPFQDPAVVLGTGRASQAVAGAVDKAGDYLRFGNPIGRYLGAHFDNDVAGVTDGNLQRAFKTEGTPAFKDLTRVARRQESEVTQALHDALGAGLPERDLVSAVNMARENVPLPQSVDPAVAAAADPIGQMMRGFAEEQALQARRIGAPFESLDDRYIAYGPRQATAVEKGGPQMRPNTAAPPQTGANVKRKDPFRDIPGGTEMVNRLAMKHAGLKASDIYDDVLGDLTAEASRVAGAPIDADELKFLEGKAAKLSKRLAKMDPSYRENQVPYFSPNLPAAQRLRSDRQARSVRATTAMIEALASAAKPMGEPGGDIVSMIQAIRSLGLRTTPADDLIGRPAEGASVELLRKLARHGQGPVDDAILLDNKARREALNAWGVSRAALDPMLQHWKKWDAPSNTVQPLRVIDSATNLFKNLAYSVWFPSHFRNAFGGGVTNAQGAGAGLGQNLAALSLMRDYATAGDLARAFPHMPAGLTDEAARAWAKRDAYVNAGVFGGINAASEMSGVGPELMANVAAGNRVTPLPPGSGRTGTSGSLVGDMLGLFREGLLGKVDAAGNRVTSPKWFTKQSGLYDRATGELRRNDGWSVTNAGRVAGTNVEDYSRLVGYLGGLRRGMAPEVAGDLTNKIHFDYADMTDFERKVMRRLVPFYCVPVDHEILTQDGWKTYDQIKVGDPVMGYDHETGEMRWVPLQEVAVFEFDGELLKIERNKSKNPRRFLFTEDHRWPIRTERKKVKGKWYGGERKIVRAKDLKTTHRIPLTGEYSGEGEPGSLSPRLAAILGWVVTDGYMRWRGNYCEMLVYQSPKKYLDEVEVLVGNERRPPHPVSGVCAVPVKLEDARAIVAAGFRSKEDLPSLVGRLSRAAADAMWDAMFKAEGWETSKGQKGFAQDAGYRDNRHVLDAFQILCLMTGRSANLNGRGCYIKTEKEIHPRAKVAGGIGRERYAGKIWCPRTPTGTWVMRHDGMPIITGNTFQSRNLPLQMENLLTRPATISTQLRPIAAARGEYTPDWIGSGVAIPLGENEDGTQRYVSQLGLPIEDAFERMKFSGGLPDIPGTAMAYAAGLNPYLKGAIEQMMDRQFFSGRRLSDLKPTTAGTLGGLLDDNASGVFTQLIANSPATRFATAFDKLADDRKPLPLRLMNLMTGARVTDVDVEKARAIETRNALEDLLRGRPGISNRMNYYVRPGEIDQLSPDTVAMMRMLGVMQERARDAARQKQMAGRG